MFTVKLCRGHVIELVEAKKVSIFPCGRSENSDNDPTKRTNQVREVAVITSDGNSVVFYIADSPDHIKNSHAVPELMALSTEHWDCAYIENSNGATTERIHAY